LKVRFSPGEYPGISLDHLSRDWAGFSWLSLDAFNEESTAMRIIIRINDARHNMEFTDRFNEAFILLPGDNHVLIPLARVRNAPRSRFMDMTDIVNVCIFFPKLVSPGSLYFDNFRLEKE